MLLGIELSCIFIEETVQDFMHSLVVQSSSCEANSKMILVFATTVCLILARCQSFRSVKCWHMFCFGLLSHNIKLVLLFLTDANSWNVWNRAMVGMFLSSRHFSIMLSLCWQACRRNLSFKIGCNTHRKKWKTKVARIIYTIRIYYKLTLNSTLIHLWVVLRSGYIFKNYTAAPF